MKTFEQLRDEHEARHGRVTDEALRKLKAFHTVTQGTCECGYCGVALKGDDDAEFDHMDADGAWWRKNVGPTRKEFMMINDGTHPSADRRKFACDMCNRAKKSMPYDDYIKSDEYVIRLTSQTILNEDANVARIAAAVAAARAARGE